MNDARFDRLVRSLRSRRSVAFAVLGGSLAAGLAHPAPAAAIACLPNGKTCDPANAEECCTGFCKKKRKGKHKCVAVRAPLGCGKSKATDACSATGVPTPCPESSDGFCGVVRTKRKKKPICFTDNACSDCQSDADCVELLGDRTARCLGPCAACAVTEQGAQAQSLCVLPATIQ